MRVVRSLAPLVLVLLTASTARAVSVSCTNPDDLCTGDPCIVHIVEVQSPCVADFGNRALVIAGVVRVPNGGTLQLTAKSIVQRAHIRGRNTHGAGASIALLATGGNVELRAATDVNGTTAAGAISVQAAGDIIVSKRLTAKPVKKHSSGVGGSISLEAGGALTIVRAAGIDVSGTSTASAGTLMLSGIGGVTIGARLVAEGLGGGTIAVVSATGMVNLADEVRANARQPGATVTLRGAAGVVAARKISVGGEHASLILDSAAGDVVLSKHPRMKATSGALTASAPLGTILLPKQIVIDSKGDGPAITMTAASLHVIHLSARGSFAGGTIELRATQILEVIGMLDSGGDLDGGSITLLGGPTSGDVTVGGKAKLVADGDLGGRVVVSAPAGAVTLQGKVDVSGALSGGSVQVDAVALTVEANMDARGRAGGDLRFEQTGGGTLLLEGNLDVRRSFFHGVTSGTIAAVAPGNLTASGSFTGAPNGCVGLSAGGILDVGGLRIDVPLSPSCP